ncbi:hypothetical protein Tco_0785803 [Tanacetum coccineum]
MEGLEGSIRRISVLLLMSCNLFLEHSFGSDATVTKLSFDQILFLTSGGAFGTDDMGQKLEKEISIKQSYVLSFSSRIRITKEEAAKEIGIKMKEEEVNFAQYEDDEPVVAAPLL